MSKNADAPHKFEKKLGIVIPGDDLGEINDKLAGHGVLEINGRFTAIKRGILNEKERVVSVEPIHSKYIPRPRPSDLVIGYIEGCTNNIWFVDIGAPFNAILPMSLGPSKAEFGGARSVIDIGEAIICRVQEVEETHSSVVSMKGMGLRKINSGIVEQLPPHLIGRIIGKGGKFLSELKSNSECRIVVADNGRIWVDGEITGIFKVRNTISKFVNKNRRGDN
tara:strand:- start:139 stop:804 length:666 start_codon:yes stop_codon:yes gene_type:complete